MSGFKEIIQNIFCVLSPQIPKYNHFRDIDISNGTMVGGKRSSSKSKREKFLILLRISASNYLYVCMELLQAMANMY